MLGVIHCWFVDGDPARRDAFCVLERNVRGELVVGRRVAVFAAPVWFHYALAQVTEWTMTVPLVAKAQVRMLAEGVVDVAPPADPLPADLAPTLMFTDEQIRLSLPEPGGFGMSDLRLAHRAQ